MDIPDGSETEISSALVPKFERIVMRKCKIQVFDYSDARHGASATHYDKDNPPQVKEYNVEAYCVGGDEGILAYFIIDGELYTAEGDDGHWWLTSVCSTHWIQEMVEAILAVSDV